jgi:hypothetical protein
MLSKYFNKTILSEDFNELLPELVTQYGAGKEVQIAGMFVNEATSLNIGEDWMHVNGGDITLLVTIGEDTVL